MNERMSKAAAELSAAIIDDPRARAYKEAEAAFLSDEEARGKKAEFASALVRSEDPSLPEEERKAARELAAAKKAELSSLPVSKRYSSSLKEYREMLLKIDRSLFLFLEFPSFFYERILDDQDRRR